jgi:hypothetical protein
VWFAAASSINTARLGRGPPHLFSIARAVGAQSLAAFQFPTIGGITRIRQQKITFGEMWGSRSRRRCPIPPLRRAKMGTQAAVQSLLA